MDTEAIFSRFVRLAGLEADGAEGWKPLCAAAAAHLAERLLPGADAADERLLLAAAGEACYQYALSRQNAQSIRVGDISLSPAEDGLEGTRLLRCLLYTSYFISCDYGTVNPASFGLWGEAGGVWYRLEEYYHDSRRTGELRTDEEYYAALEALAGDRPVEAVVVDPSAASFLACIRRHGRFTALPAKNDCLFYTSERAPPRSGAPAKPGGAF